MNNFEGGAHAKKNAVFRSKFSNKCLKTPFITCFFFNLPAGKINLTKKGLYKVSEELGK